MNKRLSRRKLMQQLRYDPIAGLFWWRIRGSHRTLSKPAGSFDKKGYRAIKIAGRSYRANRLAWLFMTGKWPTKVVDHKDTSKGNDAWINLRKATDSQNKQNGQKYVTNTSGFKGVHWDKEARKWRAQIRVNKKGLTLGRFATREEASCAYIEAAHKYFGEFARV